MPVFFIFCTLHFGHNDCECMSIDNMSLLTLPLGCILILTLCCVITVACMLFPLSTCGSFIADVVNINIILRSPLWIQLTASIGWLHVCCRLLLLFIAQSENSVSIYNLFAHLVRHFIELRPMVAWALYICHVCVGNIAFILASSIWFNWKAFKEMTGLCLTTTVLEPC